MRKNIKKFAGIVLCIGMFTGCAQTPDSSLVKPKGSKAVDAYTEADDVSGSKGEASESKNDDGSESKTTIRNLIDAPQNYKSHVEDDSAKLVVNTDASVEIPEVEKISAISVTAAEVTQELLDRITNAFFSEAKLYTMDSYYVKTKDEIKKTLDELKEDVANGNLDPYNYGTDDDGNYVYDIYEDIETWEQEYETAPEKKTLTEAKPVAGNYFSCIAQMPDDSQYYYMISSDGSDTLSVKIKKAANTSGKDILYQDTVGGQISVDGKNWVDEADYEKNNAAPDVQWWTADEYEAWMNEQKKEMESLIGTGDGWYDGQGVFHEFTQESVDAMMDSYKETLESIKKGVLYSKDDGDGDTYSMIPPTEDVVSSYSVDVTKDNGKTVHIGDYSTVEELDKAISDAVKNGQLTQEEADSVQHSRQMSFQDG